MRLIKRVRLKFGPRAGAPSLEFEPTGITLFVGPNNAGKSLVLREIERFCALYERKGNHILDEIEFRFPSAEVIITDLRARSTAPNENERIGDDQIVVQRITTYPGLKPREIIPISQVSNWVGGNNRQTLAKYYVSMLTVRLDGATRTTLLKRAQRTDLLEPPGNLLTALFVDDTARKRIRGITYDAFERYFVIDALDGNHLRARLADREPVDDAEEQALDARARGYHRSATEIVDASDGVKAFAGMIASILGQNTKVPLIDEPEAFLHPPLARRLGKELAEAANRLHATAFVATHSANFLMGCISGSPLLNIVRLTFKNGNATARLLTYDRLNEIIKSPLMRSTGVLEALFHEGAVICEGDSDRALYEELNERIATVDPRSAAEAIFINAHTKQATGKIAGPLRHMGIPAAVVVDFDIFNDTDDFKYLLRDLNIPAPLAQGWGQTKALLVRKAKDEDLDTKTRGLQAITDSELSSSFRTLMDALRRYGIFVVPGGELESWLSDLAITTDNKKNWLLGIFEKLGGDPAEGSYLRPSDGDVWAFLRDIAEWINNPNREGM